jgi:hypothetical protein
MRCGRTASARSLRQVFELWWTVLLVLALTVAFVLYFFALPWLHKDA